jgi:transcriptional regulator with XRE-family HTH domain
MFQTEANGMGLLTKEEFYERLGHALEQTRLERGLSQAEVAERLNGPPIDLERVLRRIAALSVTAQSIRRRKGLTRKEVAERGNLPIEFVGDIEAGNILSPEVYPVYCLSYGLGLSFSKFEGKVDRLSRIELDENDDPVHKPRKRAALSRSDNALPGPKDQESAAPKGTEDGTPGMGGSNDEPPCASRGL